MPATMVKIKDGYWQDHFTDNTYSKLFFKWTGTYDFELEFVIFSSESTVAYSKRYSLWYFYT